MRGAVATNVKAMMAAANAAVPRIGVTEARELVGRPNVLVLDVRDGPEVSARGKIKGTLHVSRGMLEFRADAELPSHDPAFAKDKTILVYCASGGRSALAGKTLKDMGYVDVRNLGGFDDWVAAGGPVEAAGS